MFAFYKKHNNNLYNKLVEFSRNIFFYKDLGLKDNFETRIILIFMHLAIILNIVKNDHHKALTQSVFDNVFQNVEYHMRELGHGDVSVSTKMKLLSQIFYDILLKILINEKENYTTNKHFLNQHLLSASLKEEENKEKLAKYFDRFYNFCFVLDRENMLKGQINFKFN